MERAGTGNRTPDLFITSESLCRLSYPGVWRARPLTSGQSTVLATGLQGFAIGAGPQQRERGRRPTGPLRPPRGCR